MVANVDEGTAKLAFEVLRLVRKDRSSGKSFRGMPCVRVRLTLPMVTRSFSSSRISKLMRGASVTSSITPFSLWASMTATKSGCDGPGTNVVVQRSRSVPKMLQPPRTDVMRRVSSTGIVFPLSITLHALRTAFLKTE